MCFGTLGVYGVAMAIVALSCAPFFPVSRGCRRGLKRSGFGLLNHLLAGIQVHFHPAIFLPAGGRAVVGYGIGFAHTLYRFDLDGRDSAPQQIAGYTLSPFLRQVQVLLVALLGCRVFPALVIGISIDGDVHIAVLVQHVVGKFTQRRFGRGAERGAAAREEYTRVEGHFYGLQPVVVGDLLDLRAFYLFGLFGGFVHLFTNKGSGGGTNGRANGGTDGCAFPFSKDSSQSGSNGCAASSADKGAFPSVRHVTAGKQHAGNQYTRHDFEVFHNDSYLKVRITKVRKKSIWYLLIFIINEEENSLLRVEI